jgi:hypothetical protein
MRRQAAVALAVVALTACGGDSGGNNGATPGLSGSAADAKEEAGCPNATEATTEELYVQHLYDCDGNSLYVFADSTARDNYRKVAQGFGAVVLHQGDTWILSKGAPVQ